MRMAVRYLAILLLAALPFAPSSTLAQSASEWSADLQSRMRLISAGPDGLGGVTAAVEIILEPGFKTYWRSPGESGVPPLFVFSASENLASAEVLFPRPERFEDGGGFSIGYHDRVIFPVRTLAADPSKPVRLVLTLAYGACEKICIPASGTADLTLGEVPEAALKADIDAAYATVPKPLDGRGAPGDALSIAAISPLPAEAGANAPATRITVEIAGEIREIFVEGPTNWYAEASAPTMLNGKSRVAIALYGPRKTTHLAPCPIRLTIIGAGKDAVERSLALDECGTKP
jgi:DsbC/DsbD-like thiol-disulfide interchange protein